MIALTALAAATPGPTLWYLNRGTGVVLLVLLTATTCLGLLSSRTSAGGLLPAFVSQTLHRDLSLLAVGLLAGHVTTAVLDEYVDIRWWQAFSPVGATYKPLWMALGAVALDLIAIVVLSSLVRTRTSRRTWRTLHWCAYVAWPLSFAHGAGIGTDAALPWARTIGWACLAAVLLALVVRWVPSRRRVRSTPEPVR
jgi:DMSO/TMAO reductase YedYZ heme-binding membrane subunit